MFKNSIKVVGFIFVCILVLGGVNQTLKFKYYDGIEQMELLYEQPKQSIDVLCLGSSHTFESINTGLLWDSWGIASYNLSGSVQPLWNTYYYLREALNYQSPRVIVLDVYRVLESRDFVDQSRIVKNTFGMKNSENKLDAKRSSSAESELMEYVLEFPHYHARYSDLSKEDFLDNKGIKSRSAWKGLITNFTTASLPEYAGVTDVTERSPLPEKSQEYLYQIIDLCKENSIPLVLFCAPYPLTAADQQCFNTVADIAKEQDIPFLNYNTMGEETGIGFSGSESCLASDLTHLNHKGNIKFTQHLGSWLKENYDLPDRRNEDNYSTWQIDADNIRAQYENHAIIEKTRLSDWLEAVGSQDRFTAVLVFDNAFAENANFDIEVDCLRRMGIDPVSVHGEAVLVLRGGEQEFFSGSDTCIWHEEMYSSPLMVEKTFEGVQIEYGFDDYLAQANGVSALLYDEATGELVESVWWSASSYEVKNVNVTIE